MNYIDQLKQCVAEAFKDATDKKAIDQMANINAAIQGVENENATLMSKNQELIAAYKQAVLHPGISKTPDADPTQVPEDQKAPDFADFVKATLK